MNTNAKAPLDQRLRDSKTRDRALVLPLAGVLLLISPVAGIFQLDAKLSGVPFTLIYLFTIWAILIAGAALLSRRLRDGDSAAGVAEAPERIRDHPHGSGPGQE